MPMTSLRVLTWARHDRPRQPGGDMAVVHPLAASPARRAVRVYAEGDLAVVRAPLRGDPLDRRAVRAEKAEPASRFVLQAVTPFVHEAMVEPAELEEVLERGLSPAAQCWMWWPSTNRRWLHPGNLQPRSRARSARC